MRCLDAVWSQEIKYENSEQASTPKYTIDFDNDVEGTILDGRRMVVGIKNAEGSTATGESLPTHITNT